METAMTKCKTITTVLAALTLATTLTAFGGQAQAHSHWGRGWGIGAGFAAGALIGAAATSNAYYYEPAYSCRYVGRYDRWGNLRTVRVCDVPY
jgi:hypothetical protein